jgi:hypothetical protein
MDIPFESGPIQNTAILEFVDGAAHGVTRVWDYQCFSFAFDGGLRICRASVVISHHIDAGSFKFT